MLDKCETEYSNKLSIYHLHLPLSPLILSLCWIHPLLLQNVSLACIAIMCSKLIRIYHCYHCLILIIIIMSQ